MAKKPAAETTAKHGPDCYPTEKDGKFWADHPADTPQSGDAACPATYNARILNDLTKPV